MLSWSFGTMADFDYANMYSDLNCVTLVFIAAFLLVIHLCNIMYEAGDAPECCCGEGEMVLLKAGKHAMNAGRYYLKCPADGKHPMSFKWYDAYRAESEWHSIQETGKQGVHIRAAAVSDHSYSNGACAHCFASFLITETKVNVLLGLLGLLLVAVCIMIGKLM